MGAGFAPGIPCALCFLLGVVDGKNPDTSLPREYCRMSN
jgi:hypothetical protein